jgi:hypothetical protein
MRTSSSNSYTYFVYIVEFFTMHKSQKSQSMDMTYVMFFYVSVVKRLEIILFVTVFSGRLSIFDAVSNFEKKLILSCLFEYHIYHIHQIALLR